MFSDFILKLGKQINIGGTPIIYQLRHILILHVFYLISLYSNYLFMVAILISFYRWHNNSEVKFG
jgi:hypothetical protein